jgi:YidC/Oxa1 family membrane protein insertase
MHDQDNQKNLLLAIALSVGVLLAWQLLYAGPKLKEEQQRHQRITQEQSQLNQPGAPPKVAPDVGPGVAAQSGVIPSTGASTRLMTREEAVSESPRLRVDTPSLQGSIALKGGRIDDLVLAKYHLTVDPTSPHVVLFSPSGSPEPYYAEFGWVAGAGLTQPVPGRDTLWRVEGNATLTPSSPVTLLWDNGQGLRFKRKITVDADYLITISDEVENQGTAEISLYPYALISRHGLPKVQGYYILHEGLIGVLGSAGLQEIKYADALKAGGSKTFKQTGGWLGITDKYWAAALIPDQTAAYDAELGGEKGATGAMDRFQTGYTLSAVALPPGAASAVTGHLFAGAKQTMLIDGYATSLGAKQFDLLIDWGWFFFITKPLFKLLHWLSQLLGNYGLAILATTVLVKAAFFPLANKSYESMAKMKKLQPEMEKIRARFKDDRVRQQQEMMALYKTQKINPLAGCLPMVLQIPVFFALYKVLFITIDMRQAPFFGWIKDLSAPDPTSVFNLFGLLPFAAPEYLHVGVWPLVMGATMWVQMQLNPQQPDPMQQKIFNWMPVIFTFMLASFPSGLVIYWAWNNVLSLLQQYTIMVKNNTEIHLWKNLGVHKWKDRIVSLKRLDVTTLKDRASGSAASLAQTLGGLRKRFDVTLGGDKGGKGGAAAAAAMTREQALRALGLEPGASQSEIETALRREADDRSNDLNGSDHAIASKIDQAREILRGKERS